MSLKIPVEVYDQLRQHGEATYPHECCGVLAGVIDAFGARTVKSAVRCGNTRTDSLASRYHIRPSELVRIQRDAMLAGHDIVGFYHSHPDHPAYWSTTDLAEAYWTGCSYVITSVEQGRAAVTNSFLLLDQEESRYFAEEPIEVIQEEPMLRSSKPRLKGRTCPSKF
jgi:proteasome lid subunit RPN8/RPN11